MTIVIWASHAALRMLGTMKHGALLGTLLTSITLAACDDPSADASKFFWDSFTQQRLDHAEEAVDRLQTAYDLEPGDADNTLRLGLANLWWTSEFARTPAPDPSTVPTLAGNAQRYLAESMMASPEDARIPGWLSSIMIGNGVATQDPQMIADGFALLGSAVERYPEFNLFVEALVLGNFPTNTPEFQRALEAMWANVEVCTGSAVDRRQPNFGPLIDLVADGSIDPACGNPLEAAHNFEGFFLYFGDLMTKSGDVETARVLYEVPTRAPAFADWPYAHLLQQRRGDVDTRAALWANADPSDDPLLVTQEPYSCAFCHASAPHEPRPR